jgi:hypothetical protein
VLLSKEFLLIDSERSYVAQTKHSVALSFMKNKQEQAILAKGAKY